MGMRLLFYVVFYPLSALPMTILYGIAHIFYLFSYYIIGYRKKIVTQNLRNSFPDKTDQELKTIRRKFYIHLGQIAAEMLKMLTISKKELQKRYYCSNPEMVNGYMEKGKSVILMSSHYNNWEWMVLSLDSLFNHHGIGVGKPNSNKIFELLINKARTRYGTEVVFADTVRDTFEHYVNSNNPAAFMMLSDQSPPNPNKSYKAMFLHQPSAFLFGSEYFAKKYNLPVLYYQVIKEKRGYYRIDIEVITENPTDTAYGYITKSYIALLEKTLRSQPEYWLWSHKRWKHNIAIDSPDFDNNPFFMGI